MCFLLLASVKQLSWPAAYSYPLHCTMLNRVALFEPSPSLLLLPIASACNVHLRCNCAGTIHKSDCLTATATTAAAARRWLSDSADLPPPSTNLDLPVWKSCLRGTAWRGVPCLALAWPTSLRRHTHIHVLAACYSVRPLLLHLSLSSLCSVTTGVWQAVVSLHKRHRCFTRNKRPSETFSATLLS